MLLFPALLGHRWVCYSWNLHINTITVLDPALADVPDGRAVRTHKHLVNMIKSAIQSAMVEAYYEWQYDWESGHVEVIRPPPCLWRGMNHSGFAVARFCSAFDGTMASVMNDNILAQNRDQDLLLDALKLGGNKGYIPADIV